MTIVVADARPEALNVPFRPGNSITLELGWPTGELAGRTFTSTLEGVALDLTVIGDTMVIEASEAQTLAVLTSATWLLTETTGGASNDLLIGEWAPSTRPGTPTSLAATVTAGAVEVDVTVVSGQASIVALEAAKVDRDGDTMTGSLVLSGSSSDLTVGGDVAIGGASGVTLSYQAGTIDSLLLDGQLLSAHDALYVYAAGMKSNGTEVPESAQDVGVPRWSLADGATQRVKWVFEIPAEWDQVAVRFGWDKENTGSGNVNWSFAYRLVYPFVGDNVDTGAVTTVSLGSIAVPSTQFALQYEIPAAISAINVADGFIGSKPFMLCSLSRDGAGDTYAGAVAVSLATLTRTV